MTTSLKVLTANTGNRKDTWNTPKYFVNDLLKFFDVIDLDPCSDDINNPNIPALNHFTKEINGLSHDWNGKVFMNHPYSESKLWVNYAVEQYKKGNSDEIVMLIKLDVSTKWFKSIAKYPWIAINKRMKFGEEKTAAPFQSAIIYLGNNLNKFKKIFGKYGYLYRMEKI